MKKLLITLASLMLVIITVFSFGCSCNGGAIEKDENGLLFKPEGWPSDDFAKYYVVKGVDDSIKDTVTEIVIPVSFNERMVTDIGEGAFNGCISLEKISIPMTVDHISQKTFADCPNLKEVRYYGGTIDDWASMTFDVNPLSCNEEGVKLFVNNVEQVNVTLTANNISKNAFLNCSSIEKVTLKDSVTSVNENAFESCNNLEEVVIEKGLKEIKASAFSSCSKLDKINLPNSIISIEKAAFQGCGFTEIVIPNSIKKISNSCFSGCSKLASVTLPNSITELGASSFASCISLEGIEIPETVTSIGESIFAYSGLKQITIPNAVSSVSSSSFEQCKNLSLVNLPSNATEIGSSAFKGCISLEGIEIPETVASIGESIFAYSGLKQITIPNAVSSVSASSFEQCKNLSLVNLPSNATEIGSSAFKGCVSLEGLTIPETLTRLGSSAFMESALKSIVIPAGVEEISSSAFKNCSDLASVTLQTKEITVDEETKIQGATEIGSSAFIGCVSLEGLAIPETLTSLGSSAFMESAIKSIVIPAGVEEISSSAFENCSDLASVTLQTKEITVDEETKIQGATNIGSSAFKGCVSLEGLTIPETLTGLGSSAFMGAGVKSVTIGKNIVSIGDGAFNYCVELNSINVDAENEKYLSTDGNLYSKDGKTLIQYAIGKTETTFIIADTVETISANAFAMNDSLTNVVMDKNITRIGDGAFNYCVELNSINVDAENEKYLSTDGNLYSKDGKTLIQYAIGKTETTFTIADAVETISANAFAMNDSLTNVVMGKNIKFIKEYAFASCVNLANFEFVGTVEEWNGISVSVDWNKDVLANEVICSDGNVQIK